MEKPKVIYCPQCNRKVATWDGKSSINIIVNCKNCSKQLVFRVDSGKIETKKMKKRTTSSGMTFY